jgi:hypothetical protein
MHSDRFNDENERYIGRLERELDMYQEDADRWRRDCLESETDRLKLQEILKKWNDGFKCLLLILSLKDEEAINLLLQLKIDASLSGEEPNYLTLLESFCSQWRCRTIRQDK